MSVVEKRWIQKGLPCVVVATEMGHRCGYVGVLRDHPLWGVHYSENTPVLARYVDKIKDEPFDMTKTSVLGMFLTAENIHKPEIIIQVHGGVTYSSFSHTYPVFTLFLDKYELIVDPEIWWIGFDCNHYMDAPDLAITAPEYLRYARSRGFTGITRTLQFCIDECNSLAEQLFKIQEVARNETR